MSHTEPKCNVLEIINVSLYGQKNKSFHPTTISHYVIVAFLSVTKAHILVKGFRVLQKLSC